MNITNLLQVLYKPVYDCDAIGIGEIPGKIAFIIHAIYNILLVGVPLLLIIFGMLDLGKAVMASKEDEIKKGQKTFVSRLIAAVIMFFIFAVVKLVVGLAVDSDTENNGITDCIDALINYDGKKEG